jgi:hypothetical protein
MFTGPVLDPRDSPWTPRPASILISPSHSVSTIILASAFTSCSTLLVISESHPQTVGAPLSSPGRCHQESLLVKQWLWQGDYFPLWKQEKPLSSKPPPWAGLVRKEVGHKMNTRSSCVLNQGWEINSWNSRLRWSNPSGWLVCLGLEFFQLERGKGQRREGLTEASYPALW